MTVLLGVGEFVPVAVSVAVDVSVGVPVKVEVAVGVAVSVTVEVCVGESVSVGLSVGVAVSVMVAVGLAVSVAVEVGVAVRVSILTVTRAEGPLTLPAASVARAVRGWLPSASTGDTNVKVPPAVAVVVPSEARPSKISTLESASAKP